jgi:POT family proton-dependent oligopeptide transporter
MTMPSSAETPRALSERTLFGHPIGLYVLFLAQMWERFSYFGMLALLILYLNQYFKLPQGDASNLFKWYTSAIYFTPLIGAYLADRWLGHKLAVVIGAILMALGHFLMAFPSLSVLYMALILLVVGCGLLTPPLTTQVGLLYPPNDPRRDSAYTIFYMGINLGAFLAPLACGWLAENTRGRFHSGFTLAGIGMVIALVTYVLGQRWIREIEQGGAADTAGLADTAPRSEPAAIFPSAVPLLHRLAPGVLLALGMLLAVIAPLGVWAGLTNWDTVLFLELAAVAFLLFGWIARSVQGGWRDRVLAILVLTIFSICYWAGAGQSGNAINLWAEQNTDRYLTDAPRPPDLFPDATPPAEADSDVGLTGFWERWTSLFQPLPRKSSEADKSWGEWWASTWNPIPTAWFQSINPLLILLLAPGFAWLWPWLERRRCNPSIPTKMGLGLLLMALAFAVLWGAGTHEAQETRLAFPGGLPAGLVVNTEGQLCRAQDGKEPEPYDAGRLFFDATRGEFRAVGVFPDLVRDEIVGDTAPAAFVKQVEELQAAALAAKDSPGWKAQVRLDTELPELDLRYAGFGKPHGNHEVHYDPATRTLTTTIALEEKEIKGLKVAAGNPELRSTLDRLMVQADTHRVSLWWLAGFFLLATLGELCLSPVGLSMVSQIAPARFATMLMGLWLLTFAFGNFVAGSLGEKWGTWSPVSYFAGVFALLAVASVLFFLVCRKIGTMMHEGKGA